MRKAKGILNTFESDIEQKALKPNLIKRSTTVVFEYYEVKETYSRIWVLRG